jgi:hypothetical protein
MFGPILDVAIGLVFTFLLFSVLLSTVTEALAAVFRLRAQALENALVRLIENPATSTNLLSYFTGLLGKARKARAALPAGGLSYEAVYNHPLVGGDQGRSKPSYVPADQFASALLAKLAELTGAAASGKLENDVAAAVAALPTGKLKEAMTAIVGEAGSDLIKLKTGVEAWFNAAMDRLSGDYKRFAQLMAFLIALGLAVGFNVDAVHVAYRLYNEPALRDAMTKAAGDYVKTNGALGEKSCASAAETSPKDIAACKAAIDKASTMLQVTVPVGWANSTWADAKPAEIVQTRLWSVLGWLITALAGMVGAAYWFQLLTMLINLRGTGPKPEEKKEKKA